MRSKQDGRSRVLTDLQAFRPRSGLDHIVAAHAVLPCDLVRLPDQGKAGEGLPVEGDRDTRSNRILTSSMTSGPSLATPSGMNLFRWMERRIFQPAALDTPAPAVFVDAVGVLLPLPEYCVPAPADLHSRVRFISASVQRYRSRQT